MASIKWSGNREEEIKLVILSNYPKDSWSLGIALDNLWNTFLDKMRAVDFPAFTFIGRPIGKERHNGQHGDKECLGKNWHQIIVSRDFK